MPKIIQLDRHVADLIAAGEVVERPASAVKELVENSIDAGAKNITIELQNGGMTFLRITDDGCGMEPVDARTAFLRHATSKIRKKEDLACIGTLGFRGEALAAISSVSKIDLLTRAQGAENGVRLHLEAGQVLSEEPAGCPYGTTILVRELFYNTPARMKFMKSDAAESSAVFSVVQQQALAHPEISFRFLKDGQEQLHTDGQGDRMAAIYAIYGRELANNMLPVDGSWEKLRVRGFVTKPTATRGNRAWQSFFVNNRYIKSRLLSAALEEAYRNQIMVGRFPACVLEIDMPVQAVDVNVHPAKTEVKFLSEREVFDAVHYAVLSTLSIAVVDEEALPAAGRPEWKTPEKKQEAAPQPQSQPKAVQPPKPGFYQTMQASEYRRQAAQQPVQKPAQPVLASPVQLPHSEPVPAQQSFPLPKPEAKPEVRPEPKPEPKIEVRPEPKPEPVKEPEAQQALSVPEEPFRIIGEALHTYVIVEQGEAVLFLDKHAAHERIRFEALKKEDHPIMAQLLLAPVSAELSREEAAAVLENRALLERCGFETEDFGGGDVLIRQIPSDVDVEDAKALLQELAGDLLAGKTLDPDSLRDNLLHTIACKSAIKAGWQTSDEELRRLVQEVLSRDDIKYCPHGRPVCVTLTKRQLEKQFKRV